MEQNIKKILSNRIYTFLLVVFLGFLIITARLFTLQIVKGEENAKKFEVSITREIPIKSARGSIYDRNGVPIADNRIVYNVKFDSSNISKKINEELLSLIRVLEENEHAIDDTMPITIEKPYKFLYTSEDKEKKWKKDNGLSENLTSDEVIAEYIKKFDIKTEGYMDRDIRLLVGLRTEINKMRYRKYNPIDIATDVSKKVITIIEENNVKYPGVYVQAEPIRYYPNGETFAHIVGYVGNINNEELTLLKDKGYTESNILGKLGIEKEMESELRGIDGEKYVEVDNFGRVLETTNMTESKAGNDVFLTIDVRLQMKAEEILKKKMTDIIIARIFSKKPSEQISVEQIFTALVKNNVIDVNKVLSEKKDYQKKIASRVKEYENTKGLDNTEILYELYNEKKLYYLDIIMLLIEQGKINATDAEINNIKAGNISYLGFIVDRMGKGEITPQDLAFNPSTGAVIVQDVNTGEILSLVNYPSYDNNKLANHFDYEYYKKLLSDTTTPLINRALSQRKAPGSIFKMITAIAGLEENAIGLNDYIIDEGEYTKAGKPYAKCWSFTESVGAITHAKVDIRKSLEVSCNYFYYELSYRLGFTGSGTSRVAVKGINTLNKYASMFGLNEKTGIELEELESLPQLSSPENKEKSILRYNKKATKSQTNWYDGDTIRSAIGQGWSNFAPIHIAKYMSTLANGGNKYKTYIVKSAQTRTGEEIMSKSPVLEAKLDIDPNNIKIVKEGMLAVTSGKQGTTRKFFADFPMKVAAKTGTAQEGTKPAHAWLVAFAPYEKPQIAVVVMIPYGYASSNAVSVGRDVIAEYFNLYKEKNEYIEMENVLVE
ncbi:MAG TPA: hypothetical protein DEP72_07270 [Clostridiales bacterium]|nr:MAG: hypothetical protein A2Y18_06385 [Clostridiales bacterium GWD2_32_19]HCC07935.1 hypothetical protein [Clostridiales bacterium]